MKFQFRTLKEDYTKSLNGIFIYYLYPSLFFSVLFGLILSLSIANPNHENSNFNWVRFLVSFPIITALFLFLSWGRKYLKSIKDFKKKKEKISDSVLSIEVVENGIQYKTLISDKDVFKPWSGFKQVYESKNFNYFIFNDGQYLFLNNFNNSKESIHEFTTLVKEKIKPFQHKISKGIIWSSFIPVLGLIFGFVIFIRGISERNLNYFSIGILSFVATVVGWIVFGIFMDATEKNSGSNKFSTKNNLNQIVKELAYYKLKNGEFPENLDSLRLQNQFLSIYETDFKMSPFSESKFREFYYENQDTTYILRAIGPDEKPFTEDDILPDY
ncbi:hypothetical protein [Moheibacter lacus]|uniref:YcxB-like protein n=1 Tax=Moheibacter lacus TaxID=2745851 RepID=A0A838ZRE3_9FLAO|nr:hypothetical protein [Moheibacter lacus]MBA5628853.1 hypothetical protein [Moheibacter lacus]